MSSLSVCVLMPGAAVPIPTTAVKVAGKCPAVAGAAFVAPSANLVGAVTLGEGVSTWYSSVLQAKSAPVVVGELSSIGDRALVVDSVLGKSVHVGAGAIVSGAKLADSCSVGMGCVVSKGASLGSGAQLAAGSVLPSGASVPANELWGGAPAKKIAALGPEAAVGTLTTCEVTAALAKVHMEEAWKDLMQVEEEAEDAKRAMERTPERLEVMRFDPKWVPLPSLGEYLSKIGAHSNTHVPP